MKFFYLLVIVLFLLNNCYAERNYFALPRDSDDVLSQKLFQLREVKLEQKHLHKIKGQSANVSVYVLLRPTKNNPFYVLQVGYSSTLRFEVYNNFSIDKKLVFSKDFEKHLKIMDLEGDYVPLSKWRRKKHL